MNDKIPLVFISYASPDKEQVLPYYDALKDASYDLWMDEKKLVAGQDWNFEIKKSFSKAQIIILFISKNSTLKRGYVQRELKMALFNLEEKLRDDIYIIPIILDETTIPDELEDLHCIKDKGFTSNLHEIKRSLSMQLEKVNKDLKISLNDGKIKWRLDTKKEFRDGLPGYDVNCQLIKISSEVFNNLDEISDFINSELSREFMNFREVLLEQDSSIYNFAGPQFSRINSVEKSCTNVNLVERVLSVQYTNYHMGAGAAHGNISFNTFNFALDFPFQIRELKSVFENPASAHEKIRKFIVEQFTHELYEGQVDEFSKEWLESGTADWNSFQDFIFEEDALVILFPPYSIAAYAYGPQVAKVPYVLISLEMKATYRSFLGIYIPI